jgi:iron complex outermembrane receptor protein
MISDRNLNGAWTFAVEQTLFSVKKMGVLLLCFFLSFQLNAQQDSIAAPVDTIGGNLDEVVIHAFESNKTGMRVAMPVAVIDARSLEQFNPQSALQAVNTIPGVHMDERSPASYRLNMRGSSMRSPFGVRNVKVYYNGLPFTEPGGTSYINQLGVLNFSGAEMVKGPGSSMYGAGTGGVLLLGNNLPAETGFVAGYAFGSYHTHTFFADAHAVSAGTTQRVQYQQSISDGYREQSASNRKILNWDGTYRLGTHYQLSHTMLFGDLYYQTPGALTLKEFDENPRAARPAAGGFPSAAQAQATIWQKTILTGISLKSSWGEGFSNATGIYTAYTGLNNATIRNYSFSKQWHSGGRSVFSFTKDIDEINLKVDAGGELQSGITSADVYDNNAGLPGSTQSETVIRNAQWFVFIQSAISWRDWELLAGVSGNNISMKYNDEITSAATQRKFTNILTPRLSLSKALGKNMFVYGSVSEGFSPPVTDELLPTGSAFNPDLQPEQGINYELGFRYRVLSGLLLQLNGYYFKLNETIVQRRDAGGGDYYVNAGNTRQPGIEFSADYSGGQKKTFAWHINTSYAWQPYTYGNFKREQDDYSGNDLPGVSRQNVYLGLDATIAAHFMVQLNYFYNSRIPLNDLNLAYGSEVQAVSGRVGYQVSNHNYTLKLFVGADNLLNKTYSLGYDINAAGGRYYNASPGRNYFCQLIVSR